MRLIDLRSPTETVRLVDNETSITALAVDPFQPESIVVGSDDPVIRLYDIRYNTSAWGVGL